MKAEIIAEKARKSISKFCTGECKAYCCRKGYLVLSSEEADLVTQSRTKEFEEKGILNKIRDGKYSLDLGNSEYTCPSLKKDFKCRIHKNPKRPLACKNFPLFLDEKTVKLSPRCLAVKCRKIYPYIVQLLRLGYKLAETNPYSDFEVNKMVIFEKPKIEVKVNAT